MVKYEIYTDGAYSSKNNTGGVGIVILRDGHLIQKFNKSYKDTTNNKMELMAVIFALKSVKQPIDSLTIYSDSMYVIGCATLGWKRKKNVLLWKLFDEVYEDAKKLASEINFVHVKGHQKNTDYYSKWNNLADNLANSATK